MKEITDGFPKFQHEVFPKWETLLRQLATQQSPRTLFISCSGSHLAPRPVTQREPGGLFTTRNAGNVVPSYGSEPSDTSASMEYVVAALRVFDTMIHSHSNCGAVTATASCQCVDHMPAVSHRLCYANSIRVTNEACPYSDSPPKATAMVRESVIAQLASLRAYPSVRLTPGEGQVTPHSQIYDTESSDIVAFDGAARQFVPLATNPRVCAIPLRQPTVT